ncbi:hypothetical protein BACCIP111899_04220 [Bacillus rhizoplanae]|uniref:Uncharacterized protein n=1 Tax=Bacillus rhizoplanae TaxID=2880966 RepID=A0ABM8YGR2_9BACI|nr:hypothetical protein [Bacillus rhizoplanae]CAG9614986.1 hypothetical protein BACCIP111899_04220 [Bacillus rhizoplanae]
MCLLCSNQENIKPAFRLFNINPIPLIVPLEPQKSFDDSLEFQKSPNELSKPPKSFDDSLESPKPSNVLLKLPKSFGDSLESRRFILTKDNSQLLLTEESSHYPNNSSSDMKEITNEIRELLYNYQSIHLRITLFLDHIYIKGFILHISKDLVTISGQNVTVNSNSTGNIIESPNRINVKIDSIQAISDVGKPSSNIKN